MWAEILRLLQSESRADRIRGWMELHTNFTLLHRAISQDQREQLAGLLLDEEVDDIWRRGGSVMLGLPQAPAAAPITADPVPGGATSPIEDESLAGWLWQPFKHKSAVFGLTDPSFRRRDELALLQLAPNFCPHSFPTTEIHLMRADDPQWDRLLLHGRYQSMCFVGRLGIFGDQVADRWGNDDCRFGFRLKKRPPDLAAGKLDKRYHRITERLPDGKAKHHQSTEENQQRLDFGVVQRYFVSDGGRSVVVVTCAGGSSLGTLAATIWAIKDLREPMGPDGDALPAPPGLTVESPLEALIHVAADCTDYAWQPTQVELRKLYAGRHVWSSDNRIWEPMASTRITLVTNGGEVVSIELDGKATSLQPGSQGFRLLVKLCDGVMQRGDGVVDVGRLAQDPEIWSGKTRTEQEVRRVLSNIKCRYLHECLVFDKDVILTAEVERC